MSDMYLGYIIRRLQIIFDNSVGLDVIHVNEEVVVRLLRFWQAWTEDALINVHRLYENCDDIVAHDIINDSIGGN